MTQQQAALQAKEAFTQFRNDFYAIREASRKAASSYDRATMDIAVKADDALSKQYPKAWCWHRGSLDNDGWAEEASKYIRPPAVTAILALAAKP